MSYRTGIGARGPCLGSQETIAYVERDRPRGNDQHIFERNIIKQMPPKWRVGPVDHDVFLLIFQLVLPSLRSSISTPMSASSSRIVSACLKSFLFRATARASIRLFIVRSSSAIRRG